jgi:hypothetical protein
MSFRVTSFEVRRWKGVHPDGLESQRRGVPAIAGILFFEEVRSNIDRPKADRSSNRLIDWALLIGEESVFLLRTKEVLASPEGGELDLKLLDSSIFTRALARVMTWLVAGVADNFV